MILNLRNYALAITLFLLLFIVYGSTQTAAAASPKTAEFGKLILKDSLSNRTCEFALSGHGASRGSDQENIAGCSFGWVGHLQLIAPRSAITLTLSGFQRLMEYQYVWVPNPSSPAGGSMVWKQVMVTKSRCDDPNWSAPSYRIAIKTSLDGKDTADFDIPRLLATEPGQVVVPGVRVLRREYIPANNPENTELSRLFNCIKIERSD